MIDHSDNKDLVAEKPSKRNMFISMAVFILIVAIVVVIVLLVKKGGKDDIEEIVKAVENALGVGSCDKFKTADGCKSCDEHIPGCQTCSKGYSNIEFSRPILDDQG